MDKATNETYFVEVPRLPLKSWYPWDAMGGIAYVGSFIFQVNKFNLHSSRGEEGGGSIVRDEEWRRGKSGS